MVKNDDGLTPLDMASREFKNYFVKKTKFKKKSEPKNIMHKTKSKKLLDRKNSTRMQKKKSSKKILVKENVKKEKENKFLDKSRAIQNSSTRIDSAGLESELKIPNPTIGPSDFKVHTILGKGSFGEVYLVEKTDTKKIYAMKVLYKSNIISKNIFF